MLVTPIVASTFVSDGGAMFGLVPKPIWSKLIPPNERNGIPQHATCMVVQLDDGRVGLVDTGCGDPSLFSEKERKHAGLSETWLLLEALETLELTPDDISFVVLTHLHWDHAGGTHRRDAEGNTVLTFPNAQHFVHHDEWFDATRKDPLLYKSYPESCLEPLMNQQSESVVLVTDMAPDILPGIRMARSGGHTRGHCVIVLQDDDLVIRHPEAQRFANVDTIVCVGDMVSTQHHLRMVFQTSYDTYPLQTREWKRDTLPVVADEGLLMMFGHDSTCYGARIERDDKLEYRVTDTLDVIA